MQSGVDDELPVVSITLVGPLRVRIDGETRHLSRMEESLVAVLGSFEDGVVDKHQLLRALWGEAGTGPSTSLRTLVSKLRHAGEPLADNRNRAKTFWNRAAFKVETDLDPLWKAESPPSIDAERLARAILDHPDDLFADVSGAIGNQKLAEFLSTRRRTVVRRARKILDIDPNAQHSVLAVESFRATMEPSLHALHVSAVTERPRSGFRLRSAFLIGSIAMTVGTGAALAVALQPVDTEPVAYQAPPLHTQPDGTADVVDSRDETDDGGTTARPKPRATVGSAAEAAPFDSDPSARAAPLPPRSCGNGSTVSRGASCRLARSVAAAYTAAGAPSLVPVTDAAAGRVRRFRCRSSGSVIACRSVDGTIAVRFSPR